MHGSGHHDAVEASGVERAGSAPRHPTVFAVVPAHNRVEQTLRCLRSLSASSVPLTAVVVDDGSTDGTADAVARHHPDAVVLRGDGNLWWAGATNRGVEHALAHGAEYVLTINQDGVLDPTAVEALLEAERTGGPALRCAKRFHLDQPDRPVEVGAIVDWTTRSGFRPARPDGTAGGDPVPLDVSGANGMLVPRRCFDEVGLFDAAHLPQGLSDWDFQLRAKARGWPLLVVPGSVVLEDRSTASLRSTPRMTLSEAARLVSSRRSECYPPFTWHFFHRHAPARRLPAILFWRYAGIGMKVVRRYVSRSGR